MAAGTWRLVQSLLQRSSTMRLDSRSLLLASPLKVLRGDDPVGSPNAVADAVTAGLNSLRRWHEAGPQASTPTLFCFAIGAEYYQVMQSGWN